MIGERRLWLLRWYSIPSWMLLGLLAHVIANNSIRAGIDLYLDLAATSIGWIALILLLEYLHRQNDGRPAISTRWLLLSTLIFCAIAIVREPQTLLIFAAMGLALASYAGKINARKLSPFLFVLRGLQEVGMFATILTFYTHNLASVITASQILVLAYLIPTARNLTGDIRDVEFDEHTLPKKFGINAAYAVSGVITAIAVLASPSIPVAAPLLVVILLLILRTNGYLLHKVFVLSSTAFFGNYVAFELKYSLLFTNLLYLAGLAIITYDFVPRKSNKNHFSKLIG